MDINLAYITLQTQIHHIWGSLFVAVRQFWQGSKQICDDLWLAKEEPAKSEAAVA